ncbi:hypothetical protein ONZ45_g8028 [Pleurotus djamor]|nr:hypothetical protein ONZ45_g8028 [Pleurotus djamor]
MPEILTLYTAKICPYAHRVELALAEANAQFTRYEIDLQNKPEWYAPKVNPASKVPAVAYGGTPAPADQPSPDSEKIAESLVLLEFVADLYPNSGLLPKDPVIRAKARFFIDAISTKFSPGYFASVLKGESFDKLFEGIEAIQNLLPSEDKATYAVSNDFTIADAAFLPFVARLYVSLKNDIGAFTVGTGPGALKTIQTDPKFARFNKYVDALFARESYKKTFDEALIAQRYAERFASLRSKA